MTAKHNNHFQLIEIPIKPKQALQGQKQEYKRLAVKKTNDCEKELLKKRLELFANSYYPATETFVVPYTPGHQYSSLPDWYGGQPVLDQEECNTCDTFATVAATAYVQFGLTTAMSPLYCLFNWCDKFGYNLSGWNGGGPAEDLLNRIKSLPWYDVNAITSSENYKTISDASSSNPKVEIDKLPCYAPLHDIYQKEWPASIPAYSWTFEYVKIFNRINVGESNASAAIKKAIDAEEIVLIGVCLSHYKGSNKLILTNYALDMQRLEFKYSKDNPASCFDGTNFDYDSTFPHEMFVVGYAQDVSGRIMFSIRNSWGKNSADQGNMYMTDYYINVAVNEAYTIYKNDNSKN